MTCSQFWYDFEKFPYGNARILTVSGVIPIANLQHTSMRYAWANSNQYPQFGTFTSLVAQSMHIIRRLCHSNLFLSPPAADYPTRMSAS